MEGLENNLDTGNVPEENSQDREEVLRLRKERKEQAKIDKQIELNENVAFVLSRLECSLEDAGYMVLTEDQKTKLVIKLESYILKHPDEEIDISTLTDAILEARHCIEDENCGIKGLLEGHQRRTLMQIAETRKERAEKTGDEEMNPYEALFETESGEYYMARLLNMPHLEEESDFMKNCVGTSDSYINRIKKGDIEILSFRHSPKFNKRTQKLDIDEPLLTIEYNLKTKTIEQIKGYDDVYLNGTEPYFKDVLESLRRLKETENDKGDKREIKKISESELMRINVSNYCLFTEKGIVDFENYNEKEHGFILKTGRMPITENSHKEFAVKLFKFVEGIELKESEIAYNKEEISENTKLYVGDLYPNIFQELPQDIEHVYTKFPEEQVYIKEIVIPSEEKTHSEHIQELERLGNNVDIDAKVILENVNLSEGLGEKIKLIITSNKSLGFPLGTTRKKSKQRAQELGIASRTLPAIAALELRKQYIDQPKFEYILMDMQAITSNDIYGVSNVLFGVFNNNDGSLLCIVNGLQDFNWVTSHGYLWAFSV
jgi:hypothetical protein